MMERGTTWWRDLERTVLRMSPIERTLIVELISLCAEKFGPPTSRTDNTLLAYGLNGKALGMIGSSWSVFSQVSIDRYRADFAFMTGIDARFVVECDGHEFHERTKEQAAHDRKRDRYMASEGWLVLRYTGSEIVKDPAGCADDILWHLVRLWKEEERSIARTDEVCSLREQLAACRGGV